MSDHAPFSEDLMIMLGAYVNGTLTADECQTVDEMAANDPRSAAELESLFLLNTDLNSAMDSLLDMPIPPKTAQFATPAPMPANTNAAPLRACRIFDDWCGTRRGWDVVLAIGKRTNPASSKRAQLAGRGCRIPSGLRKTNAPPG